MTTPDHLKVVSSNRGFRHLPPLTDTYGVELRVYESSAAAEPHLWLALERPSTGSEFQAVSAHLDVKTALFLIDQLHNIIDNHYQLRDAKSDD